MTTLAPEEVWAEVVRLLPLVRHFAGSFSGPGLDRDDLVQQGTLAAKRAVERYDPAFGARLSTFAGDCIRHAFLDALKARSRPQLDDDVADRIEARPARVDADALADALAALDRLDPFSRGVVVDYLGLRGDPRTQSDIANTTGLTRKQVNRVYRKAIAELRGSVA